MARVSRPARGAPRRNPVTLHYAYFACLAAAASLLFHACGSTGYTDSLFLAVSALTSTGLTTVPLSALSTPQQAVLCALMIAGSAMWVSFWMLVGRRRAAERWEAGGRKRGYSAAWGKEKADPGVVVEGDAVGLGSGASVFKGELVATHTGHHGSGPRRASLSLAPEAPHPEEAYAVRLLSRLVPLYALLWLGGASHILASRMHASRWAALFLATSAFANCGMALHDDNLEPFQRSYAVLFLTGCLILAGNTAFPAFLRLMLWCARGLTPRRVMGRQKNALAFVLRFPRRVYTHLFPARQTWWLVGMLLATTAVDWVAFEVMSLGNAALSAIPAGPRILDGLFQAISVRGAGFHVVPVAELYPGLRLLYMIMMYLSAFPIVIAMRHSSSPRPDLRDVTLGLPQRRPPALTRLRRLLTPDEGSAIGRHVRAQVLRDAVLLPAAICLIFFLEGGRKGSAVPVETGENIFSGAHLLKDFPGSRAFDIAFEVFSAYGCVGMSVGSSRGPASLSADWGVWGKLVLVVVMLRGRHRGLGVILGGG